MTRTLLLGLEENFLGAKPRRPSTEEMIAGSYEKSVVPREIYVGRGTMDAGIELSGVGTYGELARYISNMRWSEDSGLLPREKGLPS